MKNRQIGVLGGAFNPPHNLHLHVAQLAAEQFGLETVLFVPSGKPPHKTDLLDGEIRFSMVKAAIEDNQLFQASRIEIDREGITWSVDTLSELKQLYGDRVDLNFIIGEDNLAPLKSYDRRDELTGLCRLIVCPRQAVWTAGKLRTWKKRLGGASMGLLDCPIFPVSSTIVRDRARKGLSIRYLVQPKVADIIAEQKLYR